MTSKIILTKDASPEIIKAYFLKIRELQKGGEPFPVDLDDVWQLVYSRRDKAINTLKSNFFDGVDFLLHQNGKVLKIKELKNGVKTNVKLSTSCLEFFIARKVRPVFQVYRKIFHETADKIEQGLLITPEESLALIDLVSVCGFISVQTFFERAHFKKHNNPFDWWKHRAKILGYSVESLKTSLAIINKKYNKKGGQRVALIELGDGYELIRTAVIDLLLALGKNQKYALNIGEYCKQVAVKMEVLILDDRVKRKEIGQMKLDFKTPKQKTLIQKYQLLPESTKNLGQQNLAELM